MTPSQPYDLSYGPGHSVMILGEIDEPSEARVPLAVRVSVTRGMTRGVLGATLELETPSQRGHIVAIPTARWVVDCHPTHGKIHSGASALPR
jgi:hypothetical protein